MMKSFFTLVVVLIASLAIATAELVPMKQILPCQQCVAPTCSTAPYTKKETMKERQRIGMTRTFQTATSMNGPAEVVAAFLDGASSVIKQYGPGRITNDRQEDVVVEIDVKALVVDEDKGHNSMKQDSVILKIKAGSICSTSLPDGYEMKDITQVVAFSDEKE
jgi:hypothetical protein